MEIDCKRLFPKNPCNSLLNDLLNEYLPFFRRKEEESANFTIGFVT